MIKVKMLASRMTEFEKRFLQVYMIKLDVELVRFGVLVDGEDLHMMTPFNGQQSKGIRDGLIRLMHIVNNLARDFPTRTYEDILSGDFAKRLLTYQRQWRGRRLN